MYFNHSSIFKYVHVHVFQLSWKHNSYDIKIYNSLIWLAHKTIEIYFKSSIFQIFADTKCTYKTFFYTCMSLIFGYNSDILTKKLLAVNWHASIPTNKTSHCPNALWHWTYMLGELIQLSAYYRVRGSKNNHIIGCPYSKWALFRWWGYLLLNVTKKK